MCDGLCTNLQAIEILGANRVEANLAATVLMLTIKTGVRRFVIRTSVWGPLLLVFWGLTVKLGAAKRPSGKS